METLTYSVGINSEIFMKKATNFALQNFEIDCILSRRSVSKCFNAKSVFFHGNFGIYSNWIFQKCGIWLNQRSKINILSRQISKNVKLTVALLLPIYEAWVKKCLYFEPWTWRVRNAFQRGNFPLFSAENKKNPRKGKNVQKNRKKNSKIEILQW